MFLDPVKLAVIAVVAIVVLGPDQLPKLAHRAGVLRRELQSLRTRLDEQARSVLPDLPSTQVIASATRSPGALLDWLSQVTDDAGSDGSRVGPDGATSAMPEVLPTPPPPSGASGATPAAHPDPSLQPPPETVAPSDVASTN